MITVAVITRGSVVDVGGGVCDKTIVSLRFAPLHATATRIPFKIPLL